VQRSRVVVHRHRVSARLSACLLRVPISLIRLLSVVNKHRSCLLLLLLDVLSVAERHDVAIVDECAAVGLVDRARTTIGSSLEQIEVSACRLKACPGDAIACDRCVNEDRRAVDALVWSRSRTLSIKTVFLVPPSHKLFATCA
jgi:hypothetical protein